MSLSMGTSSQSFMRWRVVIAMFANWSRDHAKGGYARLSGVAKVMREETMQRIMDG